MKKKPIHLFLLFLILSLSCDEVLDINKDPLAATEANPNAVLPFVFAEYSARKQSELGTRMIDVYHHVGDTYNSPASGGVSTFLKGNTWRTYYSGLLGNLELLENDAEGAGESSNNVNAVAKIMKAQIFFELTCLFGAIPFTEALDGVSFPNPKFDSQEAVLDGVVGLLDEAMVLIDNMPEEGNFDFTTGDLLLGGKMARWRNLANSIKIRTLMLIRNVDTRKTDAEQKLDAAFKDAIVSAPVFLRYPGGSGAENAIYNLVKRFFGPSNEDTQVYGPSPTMRDMLWDTQDPRLDLWLVDLSGSGSYPTVPYGQFPDIDKTVYADNLIRGTYPDVYLLPGELSFYKAELILGGALTTGDAQEAFVEGITSTLKYWGGDIDGFQGTPVSDAQIEAYIGGIGAVTLEKIHQQLWLESLFRPVVAWNTVRRTGVPALKPPGGSEMETILKRFDYPVDEISSNLNVPVNKETDVPMWFENK